MNSDRDRPQQPPNDACEDVSPSAHLSLLQHEIADLAQFRAIMDCCDDAIFIIDADNGRIIDVSGSACRRLEYDRDALLSMSIGDLLEENTRCASGSPEDGQVDHLDCVTAMRSRNGMKIPCEIVISATRLEGRAIAVAIARDMTVRRQCEEQLRTALKEKEIMLKEIHHRVKNDLQVISSLLSIQSTYLADPRDAQNFQESRDRIRTMALVHEKLYQSDDLANVDFGPYVERLAANLFRSYSGSGGRVSLRVDVKDVRLDADRAIPCGLIINELVTNALKYAFPDGRNGNVTVAMHHDDDQYLLIVSDDGIGMRADFDLAETESLGLQLVNMLSNQLGGTVSMDVSHGTRFTVTFPLTPAK
jgi:two-component system, sensor histidine kinase PdtaS